MQDFDKNDRFASFPPPVSGGLGFLGSLLVSTLIGGAVFAAFHYYGVPSQWMRTTNLPCTAQPLPASGATSVLDPAVMRRSDVLFSAIEVTNSYTHPIAAYLGSASDDGKRYVVIHVAPGRSASLSVPVGVYGFSFQHGTHWCGDDRGFQDGERFNLNQNFRNEPGKTGKILVGRATNSTPAVSYTYSTPEPPPPVFAVAGSGYIDLRQDNGGQYKINGAVGGTPVLFMLDTGATITTVSNEFAWRAGIHSCRPTTTHTANGATDACLGKVPELSFGHFRVTDVDVMIVPRLSGNEALLGMNVLRHFGIEQRGGVMRISAP